MEGEVQYRVGWISAGIMLGIAIIADLIQILFTFLVPLAPASLIVTVVAEGCIFIYFWFCKVHFFRGQGWLGRLLGLFLTTGVEMVPFLDGLPTLTADTLYNIRSARKADRESFKKEQAQTAVAIVRQRAQEEQRARYYAQQAANENQREAANDNEEVEEYREAA